MSELFSKILIANRGEIAVRVIKTCRELGIQSVAVYSDVDHNALHVREADEAVHIGPASPTESYLVIDKIIAAAKQSGAEAIHPGYGFLSENPLLVEACVASGIKYIGPSAEAMRLMGNKLSAREVAVKAGAPVAPGLEAEGTKLEEFESAAQEAGYPVLIKAAAGGGGKGMRRVNSQSELVDAIDSARREAEKAFGDGTLYLEKYLVNPRHIEFQVFGDRHGNVVHLFERECSIQRRHQKIIEETPSTALDSKLRKAMGSAAVKITKASGYYNAGTVEFLLDSSGEFYFLEMNTRLQVEHPITEAVTGLDLVEEQIRVAAGLELSAECRNPKQRGHAIECRIYAEDAENNFFPSSGKLVRYVEPSGVGVRVDSGVYQGAVVGIDYDPILAKLITFADSREEAISKMITALGDYTILGLKTCSAYMTDILESPEFKSGATNTGFIEEVMKDPSDPSGDEILAALTAAALALELSAQGLSDQFGEDDDQIPSPWQTLGAWRMGERLGA